MKPTTDKRRQAAPPPRDVQTERVGTKGGSVSHQDRTYSDDASYRHEKSVPKPDGPVAYD